MSVFLIEKIITRYNQIALSDNAITLNKTRLDNERRVKAEVQIHQRERMFLLLGEFLDINLDLDFICLKSKKFKRIVFQKFVQIYT